MPSHVRRAAELLKAVAAPNHLVLLALVAERQASGHDCSPLAVASALNVPLKAMMKDAIRLQECGLLAINDTHAMAVDLSPLSDTGEALLAELPITSLLEAEPDLARFFTNGRLVRLPEDSATRDRVVRLLVRLIPADLTFSEAEVNALLNEVNDDHATLRRLMVDAGLLSRGASADYQRVAAVADASR